MPRSSTLCVDASLVTRFVAEPADNRLAQHWRRWQDEGSELVAPLLLRYEVTNALHRIRAAGQLSASTTQQALQSAIDLPIRLHDEASLHAEAMEMAARFVLPAAYDAHYLALAERLGVQTWTADRRLANRVRHALPWVNLFEP
jgi:predicted nucleic acid-binding protein